jgi:hypothetical protein
VDYQKLDDIVNIIGELIIGGSTMARGITEVKAFVSPEQQSTKLVDHLEKTSASIRKNLLNLQESIMKVRMTPIDVVFRKFPRIVRDLAVKSGKEVSLKMRGEGTDLDKTLVDHIQKRGRDYEGSMSLDYLKRLNEKYENWIDNYKNGKLLIINVDNLDFKSKPEDFGYVVEKVDKELFGLF